MSNPLMRVNKKFFKFIKDIETYRKENNLPFLTKTKITELITRHKNSTKIKEDIALFKENEK